MQPSFVPSLLMRLQRPEELIVVDPRWISLAEEADHWLQLRPGSECAPAVAMIHTIITEDLCDHELVEKHTFGFDLILIEDQDRSLWNRELIAEETALTEPQI